MELDRAGRPAVAREAQRRPRWTRSPRPGRTRRASARPPTCAVPEAMARPAPLQPAGGPILGSFGARVPSDE